MKWRVFMWWLFTLTIVFYIGKRLIDLTKGPIFPTTLSWPMGPGDVPNLVIKTYGQMSGVSSTATLHYGVDIQGDAATPVYAMEAGTVVSVENGSGSYPGLLIRSASIPDRTILYLHISEDSTQCAPGQNVAEGDCLGLVDTGSIFWCSPHLQLSHIPWSAGLSSSALPDENTSTKDPLSLLYPASGGDQTPPIIEPGSLTFRKNQSEGATGEQVTLLESDIVAGAEIDIIVHITDEDETAGSELQKYPLAPSEITLIIEHGSVPPVEKQWVLSFEGQLPLYASPPGAPDPVDRIYNLGPNAPSSIEECDVSLWHLYYVLTNGTTDGFTGPGTAGHWVPDSGDYTITVLARDAAGNEATPLIHKISVP